MTTNEAAALAYYQAAMKAHADAIVAFYADRGLRFGSDESACAADMAVAAAHIVLCAAEAEYEQAFA